MSTCPKCDGLQHCPCNACSKRRQENVRVWIEHQDTDVIECGYCGHSMSMDSWFDWEWTQYKFKQAKEQFAAINPSAGSLIQTAFSGIENG
jgi:hypothetical protein